MVRQQILKKGSVMTSLVLCVVFLAIPAFGTPDGGLEQDLVKQIKALAAAGDMTGLAEIAEANPEQAAQIAALAAKENPKLAAQIAAKIAGVVPEQATQIAALAAKENPKLAAEIAAEIAGVVPDQATAIAEAVSREYPEDKDRITSAVNNAVANRNRNPESNRHRHHGPDEPPYGQ